MIIKVQPDVLHETANRAKSIAVSLEDIGHRLTKLGIGNPDVASLGNSLKSLGDEVFRLTFIARSLTGIVPTFYDGADARL